MALPHQFQPGNKGREPGIPNKLSKSVRQAVLDAFNKMQEDPNVNIEQWGKENPKEFYLIAAKLIPTEINAKFEGKIIEVKPPKKNE